MMDAPPTTQSPAGPPAKAVPLVRRIGMWPVRFYLFTLAWLLGGHCRFTPSCSRYALEAIEKHGVFKGWMLSFYRLMRCQPFCKGGHDPVPPVKSGESSSGTIAP
jgi:putative membrane protein insertion efficiency factor